MCIITETGVVHEDGSVGQTVVVKMWHHMRVKNVITVTNAIEITLKNVQG